MIHKLIKSYKTFLESMRSEDPALIDTVKQSFNVCFENEDGEYEDIHDYEFAGVQEEENTDADVPSEDDIIINDNGFKSVVRCGNELVYEGNDTEEMEQAIRDYMEDQQWFPNIWQVNDHGNISMYTLSAQ